MPARRKTRTRGSYLTVFVDKLLDRRVGRMTGEAGRTVATAHHMALFAIAVTVAYVGFFLTYDPRAFGPLVASNVIFTLGYLACVLLARLGRTLGASLTFLLNGVIQLVVTTVFVGWESGFHLYLLMGGQLVFMMFAERHAALRWVMSVVALFAFLGSQFLLPVANAVVQMPDVLLTALFSVNALLTASMLFILAGVSHFRAERARNAAAELAAKAEYLANTDALTGLANRRPLMERLDALSAPGRAEYSLAIADIDHFKLINDEFGHSCGDRVLAHVGKLLKTSLRSSDAVGRWGGEEFVFVMPQATTADARVTMERVRASLGGLAVECADHTHSITVSIGLTEGFGDGAPHRTIRRADNALYEAKESGRNRVVVAVGQVRDAPRPATAAVGSEPKTRTS